MYGRLRTPSGHVFRVERKRGPLWYAKYRLPDGRQVQKKLGPAWTDRGRPPVGFFTKRTAEAWLQDTLAEARRGTLPGSVATGATFADAAAEWLRYVENDRDCKPSTLRDYRSVVESRLLPAFGDVRLEDLNPRAIESWRAGLGADGEKPLTNRTRNKALTILGGIMERARKVYGLPTNPVRDVEKLRERYDATRFAFYSPEEVHALCRAAESEQDAAIFLTAAFTGLRRGELVALRWRDVDFERSAIRVAGSYANGQLTTPKSGRGRVVPMVGEVAEGLARLSQRAGGTGEDDLVFQGEIGTYLDASALRRRFVAAQDRAGLRKTASTTSATRSGRSRFAALSRSSSCRTGSATPRCGRRCATRTIRSSKTRPQDWLGPLRCPSPSRQRCRDPGRARCVGRTQMSLRSRLGHAIMRGIEASPRVQEQHRRTARLMPHLSSRGGAAYSKLSDEEARERLRPRVAGSEQAVLDAIDWLEYGRDEYIGDRAYRLLLAAATDTPVRPIDPGMADQFAAERELGSMPPG